MYILKTGILTVVLMLAGCGSAPEGGTVPLPVEVVGGRPVIEMTIDGGGPYRFVQETGASMGVILPALADELELVRQPDPDHRVVLETQRQGP